MHLRVGIDLTMSLPDSKPWEVVGGGGVPGRQREAEQKDNKR